MLFRSCFWDVFGETGIPVSVTVSEMGPMLLSRLMNLNDTEDYRITNRGGKGVITLNITEKTGSLIAIQNVTDEDGLMIINKSGVAIRMGMDELRIMGRNTQGVKVINLKNNDAIAAIAKVEMDRDVEDGEGNEAVENTRQTSDSTENLNSESAE